MENLEVKETELRNELLLEVQAEVYLQETAKWAKFLSIVGFIFTGLMILISFGFIVFSTAFGDEMPFPMSLFGLLYLVLAGVYFFPIFYLFKFANNAKQALLEKSAQTFTESMKYMKSHYKFMGIFTIVMLALYPIGMIVAIIIGVSQSM